MRVSRKIGTGERRRGRKRFAAPGLLRPTYISLTVIAVVVPSRTIGVGLLSNCPSGQPKVSLLILMPVSAAMVLLLVPSVISLPAGPPIIALVLDVYLHLPIIGTLIRLKLLLFSLKRSVTFGRAPEKST